MEPNGIESVTKLLERAREGEPNAEDILFQTVYDELKRIATKLMQDERTAHTLGATGVLHEAYAKIFRNTELNIADRRHLMRLATRVMKHVLLDHARKRNAVMRGGGRNKEALDNALYDRAVKEFDANLGIEVESLHEAMEKFARTHARANEVVQLRMFGNHTMTEIAEILGVAKTTVDNDWAIARARLRLLMQETEDGV